MSTPCRLLSYLAVITIWFTACAVFPFYYIGGFVGTKYSRSDSFFLEYHSSREFPNNSSTLSSRMPSNIYCEDNKCKSTSDFKFSGNEVQTRSTIPSVNRVRSTYQTPSILQNGGSTSAPSKSTSVPLSDAPVAATSAIKNVSPALVSETPKYASPTTPESILLQQFKTRRIGMVDYILNDEPVEQKAMENPAIVIIACSRVDAILKCLKGVYGLQGSENYTVYLSLGCMDRLPAEKMNVIFNHTGFNESRLHILEFDDHLHNVKEVKDQFFRIHRHYIFLFDTLFGELHHSHVLFIEDDLELGPTALDFIRQVVPILDADPSLVCISLFNDNASAEDLDPLVMHRTSEVPNLGLLFNRRGYELIWKGQEITFSTNGWDHWFRGRAAAMNVEGLYPGYPRLQHLLYKEGTTTNLKKNVRIKRIPVYNKQEPVDMGDLSYLFKPNYDRSLLFSFLPSHLVESAYQGMQISLADIILNHETYPEAVLTRYSLPLYAEAVLYNLTKVVIRNQDLIRLHTVLTDPKITRVMAITTDEEYPAMAARLDLHRSYRGFHHGLLVFSKSRKLIVVINRRTGWYALPASDAMLYNNHSVLITSEKGESCQDACGRYSLKGTIKYDCDNNMNQFVNSCTYLESRFTCPQGCWNEVGQDLPGLVFLPNRTMCLYSSDVQPICKYRLASTSRLCVCVDSQKVVYYGVRAPLLAVTRKGMKYNVCETNK